MIAKINKSILIRKVKQNVCTANTISPNCGAIGQPINLIAYGLYTLTSKTAAKVQNLTIFH